jgi:hypothetical protein
VPSRCDGLRVHRTGTSSPGALTYSRSPWQLLRARTV